ncbi:AzlC family ABC transporter permease [Salinisphaera sp. SWV1]|uniref:AzlC family ABC transporter permease n=1 Tax=Salinisphaera sp. SWV1 TaxID=3454139 RepID=UPI003F830446
MTILQALQNGIRSAAPISLGYIPVAITFGAAATTFGYAIYVPILFSATIFAGGSQFILLAAMQHHTHWPYVVGLCALIDSRHVIYGSLIRRIFPRRLAARLPLALSLTDEVFATVLVKREAEPTRDLTAWITGVALAAYLSWVLSTAFGGALGTVLKDTAPAVVNALRFALPALFLSLALENLGRHNVFPLIAAAAGALIGILAGNIAVALFAAIGASATVSFIRDHRKQL